MSDTNYFSGIVKVLENPIQTFFNDKISVTKFRVEIPQMRKNRIVTLVFWGNLASEVKNYYQINDYILIEGYLSIRNKKNINLITKNSKQITITVLKVYPFLLKSNPSISKV
jgi:cobalamin biosynthesis Co2+ chelatase CbiK